MEYPQVKSLAEAKVHIKVLYENIEHLSARISLLESEMDMVYHTPFWKRLWFWIDGWPLRRVVREDEQKRRPWHRRRK